MKRAAALVLLSFLLIAGCRRAPSERIRAEPTVTSTSPAATPSPTGEDGSPTGSPSPPASGRSGVRGTVLLGPQCPVERPGDPKCQPKPVEADLRVMREPSGEQVASTRSGRDGRFEVSLGPGDYRIEAEDVGMGCKPSYFTVRAGQFAEVTVHCDTGIR